MNIVHLRPKQRSKYRIMLGTWYYSTKRYIQWLSDGKHMQKVPTRKATLYSNSAPNDITP